MISITLGIYNWLNERLIMIKKKLILLGNQALTEMKTRDYVKGQLLKIFDQLEEAIITTTTEMGGGNSMLSFQNGKFKDIASKMRGVNLQELDSEEKNEFMMDLKVFKVCRNYNETHSEF